MTLETATNEQTMAAVQEVALPEMVRLIAASSTEHRQKAMDIVMLVGLKVCLPILEEAVRNDDDADLRNGAMEALIAFGEMAIPHLTKLLIDDNEEVRNFSSVMLGEIGNPKAVIPLIDALQDPDPNVRHGAAEALGKIGDPRAEIPLQELSEGDFWDHFYATAALQLLTEARAGLGPVAAEA
jgi:HEAT repeat protein